MSRFTENTSISPLIKKNKRVTTKPLVWYIDSKEAGEKIVVPKGFEFDGASVPMFLGIFIQRTEPRTINASCLHDYLYRKQRIYGRAMSDIMFLYALRACGTPKYKAIIMYTGVMLFGWRYWCGVKKKITDFISLK